MSDAYKINKNSKLNACVNDHQVKCETIFNININCVPHCIIYNNFTYFVAQPVAAYATVSMLSVSCCKRPQNFVL
jgi:hypothetical protein